MKRVPIFVLRAYKKLISPYVAKCCRYEPSCSQYAVESLEEYGFFKGSLKAAWRIVRCNPFSKGGYDPVKKQKEQ